MFIKYTTWYQKNSIEKFHQIKLSDLTDFPRISEAKMHEDIFFGSYYIRQSKSYLSDIMKNDSCSIIYESVLNKLQLDRNSLNNITERLRNRKIIGMEIASRHRRSLKNSKESEENVKKFRVNYKVFIEYEKSVNNSDSIKCNRLKEINEY